MRDVYGDDDGDDEWDMDDDESSMEEFPEEEQREIRKVYEKYDKDYDNQLRFDDFKRLVHDLKEEWKGLDDHALHSAFRVLDVDCTGVIEWEDFLDWWFLTMEREPEEDAPTPAERTMIDIRNKLSEQKNIFFGFSFEEWRKAAQLDERSSASWTSKQVMLWIARQESLKVVRNYIDRSVLEDVDGETLLSLTQSQTRMVLGVKQIHVAKFHAAIKHLNDATGVTPAATSDSKSGGRSKSGSKSGGSGRDRAASEATSGLERGHTEVVRGHRTALETQGGVSRAGKMKWKKGELIGVGASGRVYKGLNEMNGSMMAVKHLQMLSGPEEMQECLAEIQLLASLRHKNIVAYFGAEECESEVKKRRKKSKKKNRGATGLYIFTEWVPGGSLKNVVEDFGPLPTPVVRGYTRQMLEGLQYLHEQGVIHRDIKGGNVLIDDRGTIKLADFGASKRLSADGESSSTEDQCAVTLKGTPYFMAPEVIRQTGHGVKADIWSLGGTVLQIATGLPPWKSLGIASPMALMVRIAEEGSTPPIDEKLEPGLKAFLGALLCGERGGGALLVRSDVGGHPHLHAPAHRFAVRLFALPHHTLRSMLFHAGP